MTSALEETTATRLSGSAPRQQADRLATAERMLIVFVFLILSGPPRLRTRDLSGALTSPLTALDPTDLLHIGAWAGAAGLVAYILYYKPYHWRGFVRALLDSPGTRWYLLFGLLGIASAAWSLSTIYTLFFAGKIVIAILAIALVCVSGPAVSFDRALRLLFAMNAVRAVALVVQYAVDPGLVGEGEGLFRGYRLYGGFLSDYGESAFLVGLWLLTVAIFGRTRIVRTLAMLGYCISWVLLIASQTRSTIITAVICLGIMVSLRRSSRGKGVLAIVGAAGLGLVLLQPAQVLLNSATRSGQGIEDLTGRTDAFDYLSTVWAGSPIYGHGYGAGTRAALVTFVEDYGLGIGSGHDVLSTVLVDLGFVGATILLLAYLAAWGQVFRLWRRTRGLLREHVAVAHLACLGVSVTISSVVSSSLASGSTQFLVLIGTAFALERHLSARRRTEVHAMRHQAPGLSGSA